MFNPRKMSKEIVEDDNILKDDELRRDFYEDILKKEAI